jgi:hypothetical protein
MYIFSGFVDISPNYIMNGAGLRGTDPQKTSFLMLVVHLEAPTQVYLFKI